MYVELCFLSAAVTFQIMNLLSLLVALVDQFLQIPKMKILLKKQKYVCTLNQVITAGFVILYSS